MGVVIFILGLIFGSFFNVCIYRIPKGKSINYPSSNCGNCKMSLRWYDLVPILSWVILKGRCRYCNAKVSFQYPLIEILTGVIYLILYSVFGVGLSFFKYAFLSSILLISAIIDINTKYVFFSVSIVGSLGGVMFSIIEIINGKSLEEVILSCAIPFLIIGGIILLTKRINGMGTGDLEIYMVIAFFITPKTMIISIFLSVLLGGIVSIYMLLNGKRKSYIPFVPFIAIGTLISITIGDILFMLYMRVLYIGIS